MAKQYNKKTKKERNNKIEKEVVGGGGVDPYKGSSKCCSRHVLFKSSSYMLREKGDNTRMRVSRIITSYSLVRGRVNNHRQDNNCPDKVLYTSATLHVYPFWSLIPNSTG